jgi:enamine deaminase RidA (YjgF/YER057c/UK114 family)
VTTVSRFTVGARMSQAVVHSNTVYIAGQVADDAVPSVAEQTRQVLAKLDALLAEAGTDKSRILSANVWLAHIARFRVIHGQLTHPDNRPPRGCRTSTSVP